MKIEELYNTERLYKRIIGNKIQYWKAELYVITSLDVKLKYEYGELDTENPIITYSNFIEAKNIGKSNETTIFEQAKKELKSIYDRQKKKGYKSITDITKNNKFELLECSQNVHKYLDLNLPKYNTDSNNCIKPMKCQKFQIGKMNYPCIGQPKINGVRCTILLEEKINNNNNLFNINAITKSAVIKSKEGLIYNVKHIQNIFTKFYNKYPEYEHIVFDGELYIKDTPVTSIGGSARNSNNPLHNRLQFVCFDLSIPDIDNENREILRFNIGYLLWNINYLCTRQVDIKDHDDTKDYIVVMLNHDYIYDDNNALRYMEDCIKEGYEGCVLRNKNTEYCFGQRPITMMKCKKFDDSEFKIIDIKSVGDPENKVGFTIIYTLQNDINNLIFECNGTGTVEEKLNIINNKDKYINNLATVKFYERTKNGLPFHANVIEIRNYE